jgi:hypothetical protein
MKFSEKLRLVAKIVLLLKLMLIRIIRRKIGNRWLKKVVKVSQRFRHHLIIFPRLFDGDADGSGVCPFQQMLDFIFRNYVHGIHPKLELVRHQQNWGNRSKELTKVFEIKDLSSITPK